MQSRNFLQKSIITESVDESGRKATVLEKAIAGILASQIYLKQKQVTVLATSYNDYLPSGTLTDQILTCKQNVDTLAFMSTIYLVVQKNFFLAI
jgi:hypothetical protein